MQIHIFKHVTFEILQYLIFQDVIFNEEIQLDVIFKSSILKDIIRVRDFIILKSLQLYRIFPKYNTYIVITNMPSEFQY